MSRIFNFNAGPSTLPLSVLEKCQAEFLDYEGTGMSIIESPHRSPEFDAVINETQRLLRELMGIPDNYSILFLGGGASLQFGMLAMNFIPQGGSADYVVTGTWAKKAHKEATIIANGRVAASSAETNFNRIPTDFDFDANAAFVHTTSNNTIVGTQIWNFPDVGGKHMICDMSSDILSRKVDVNKFSMIYAGAQKNLGPSGVTLAILRDDLAKTANAGLPTMLSYGTHIDKNSMFNTPPVFPIYIIKLVLEWIKEQGGVDVVEATNRKKAELLYKTLDNSDGYYRGTVEIDSRSWMNVPFRLKDEELEKKFIAEAKANGLVGLKGHRSVGGVRVSMYNAMPLEGVQMLVKFMDEFKKNN